MADPFIGEIRMFGGDYPPRDWAYCQGGSLDIGQNATLFSILGTTYGGNGRTTFDLPHLQGRVPLGATQQGPGREYYTMGQPAGDQSSSIDSRHMPAHRHSATVNTADKADHNSADATTVFGNSAKLKGSKLKNLNTYTQTDNPANEMSGEVVGFSHGQGVASHENRQPFLAINFILSLLGDYPSRN